MSQFEFSVLGIGAWGQTFANWNELSDQMHNGKVNREPMKSPQSASIPANERRRAPLAVKLAVETSSQACDAAGVSPQSTPCVFVSALGDTQLTDYMCRVLASDNKQLSPTKFHNSVHNAAAGYWTISSHCTEAANSVAGFEYSVPLTLMEAIVQAVSEQRALLITMFDAPVAPMLQPLLKNQYPFAVSMVIAPATIAAGGKRFTATIRQQSVDWPANIWQSDLDVLYQTSPVGRVLSVLDLMRCDSGEVAMPLSVETSLAIVIDV